MKPLLGETNGLSYFSIIFSPNHTGIDTLFTDDFPL